MADRHPAHPPWGRGVCRPWMMPRHWGISTRSAVVSATVVLVALGLAGTGLVLVLYRSLLSGIDDAASARVRDTVAALNFDKAAELDGALLSTDQRVVAVQIIDASGRVVQRSASAPDSPLVPVEWFAAGPRSGIRDDETPDNDMRISGQTSDTANGRYTVLAGGGSEAAEQTVATVALLLACAAPIVTAVAAVATYRLVKTSLRSVEAIRARVADINASDLSERVPVPAQRDEISALASTMNAMLARVEAGHAAQRRFVGDASHELRSPLASIITALEVAQDYPDTRDDELTSGTLLPEAYRMQSMVEDLLLLARADEQGLAIREKGVDLDSLAYAEVDRLRRETSLDIRCDITATRMSADPDAVARVLRNLVDNAARHARTLIVVTVDHRDGVASLSVADDGPGIAPADRQRVFGRFVRLDTDRSRGGGGAGLGLAIVADIVAAHGGTVRICDRVGGGAEVTTKWPLPTDKHGR